MGEILKCKLKSTRIFYIYIDVYMRDVYMRDISLLLCHKTN